MFNIANIASAFGQYINDQQAGVQKEQEDVMKEYVKNYQKNYQKTYHTIDTFLPKILEEEGGYTSGEKDRRGVTNYGINNGTLKEYEAYKATKDEDLPSDFVWDVSKITPNLAREIYDDMYYKRYNLDKISNKKIAEHLLDISINGGGIDAGKWLQEGLNRKLGVNLEVDGVIGRQTRLAIDEAEKKGYLQDINNEIVEKRKNRYRNIAKKSPDQKIHINGWIDRAESFKWDYE